MKKMDLSKSARMFTKFFIALLIAYPTLEIGVMLFVLTYPSVPLTFESHSLALAAIMTVFFSCGSIYSATVLYKELTMEES